MHNLGLTEIQKQINKKISQTRYKIKRTFGSKKKDGLTLILQDILT